MKKKKKRKTFIRLHSIERRQSVCCCSGFLSISHLLQAFQHRMHEEGNQIPFSFADHKSSRERESLLHHDYTSAGPWMQEGKWMQAGARTRAFAIHSKGERKRDPAIMLSCRFHLEWKYRETNEAAMHPSVWSAVWTPLSPSRFLVPVWRSKFSAFFCSRFVVGRASRRLLPLRSV